MTADRWAEIAGLWPLLVLPLLYPLAVYIRRREWVRTARRYWRAHPSIDQASHDWGDKE